MAHIYSIQVGNNTYLIEPYIYAIASGTGDAYTAIISDYDITTNTVLFLTVPANSLTNTTLSINSGTPVPIYYQNAAVPQGSLKANQTYILTYANNVWNILNNLSGGSTLVIDSNGGLEEGNDGLKIKNSGIVNNMINDATIANAKLAHSSITIAGNEVFLGDSISLSDLGLAQVLHFKGVASNNTLSDGSLKDPFSTASEVPNYSGELGDVVLDTNREFEYVWSGTSSGWIQLGGNASYKILQTVVSDPTASGATNTFIDSISQNANGEITVSKKYVSSWQFGRQVYANLATDSTTVEINGDDNNAAAIGIGVHGVLGVDNGGTGSDEQAWSSGGILYGAINNTTKYYTTIQGSQYQILTSGGTDAPVWATAALLQSIVNNNVNVENFTTLELGNNIDIANTANGHSEGRIILFSAGTEAHFLRGVRTNHSGGYEHWLPNADGYLLQTTSAGAVGSVTQPIYINANGVATALEYTANRLYYSYSTTSFEATNHFANTTQVGINLTTWPQSNQDNLYVNGDSTFNGIVKIINLTDIGNNTNGALVVDGGATIQKKLLVNDDVTFSANLLVSEKTTLTDRVGIGTSPDTATSGDIHILYIEGSTLIRGENSDVAHLDIDYDDNNQEALFFTPDSPGSGFIGTDSLQWYSASFSNLLTVGNSTSSITLDGTGFIHVENGDSSIRLATIDDNEDEVGELTITADIPTIILAPATISSSYTTWIITNDEKVFTITNDDETSLIGDDDGWQLLSHVGIGIEPDTTANDNHILVINGSTLIVNGSSNVVAHLDVDESDSYLTFIPDTTHSGYIGTDSNRWLEIYAANILSIQDDDSSFVVTIDDSQSNSLVATVVLTSSTPSISLNTIGNLPDWMIQNNAGIFTLTNDNSIDLLGNTFGFKINGRLYINSQNALQSTDTLDLYVSGDTELYGAVGIGAAPSQDYILYVEGDSQFKGHIYPQADDTYDLGLLDTNNLRWKNLFLSDTFNITSAHATANINMTVVGTSNAAVAELTLTAPAPKITLETTATGTGVEDWTIQNASGTMNFSNSVQLLRGNYYGFRLNSHLYIEEDVPTSNAYNLYVNGTTFHNGDITFAGATTSTSSPQLNWSGGGDTASVYYKVNNSNTAGFLTIDLDDNSSRVAFANNGSDTAYINTATPSFYPATNGGGSLGLSTNRWNKLYIGGADGYGDVYTPIYWVDGQPAAVVPVQAISFTIANGKRGVTLSHAAFTANSYVLQIVVTSGESNLNTPISWSSETVGEISLTCTSITSGAVSGYILVSRGGSLTVTSADIL